ncbi:PTS system mannose/fructose/sorbose family transporter subunit IID [Enterococcus pallens]|uniref:Uncharacterized protein n=3 Tax=Enterococcus TaxID=1350 RepID=R2Q9E9_9ENTE|nr:MULTISPECIES: PTS system mannose/fructose/sorbose family transporter subunit IID [Enterococcus]EOH93062.1 hypothetical protein UAU_02704 [Enterococcus pallens ATCC BAA-351]EOU24848.1 hypothetical protein I588_00835 [Enterococcus pallens ATCC BAA-351]
MKMSNTENKTFTKARTKSLVRWMFTSCNSLNYEKQLSLAYAYSMLPVLQEVYKDKPEDLKKSMTAHLQFFNCTPWVCPYILGLNVGIEENEGAKSLETVTSLKTALMGPLSALGDTVMITIPWTIFGAIASYMALEGNVFGIILWLIVSLVLLGLSFPFFKAGLISGMSLIDSLNEKMASITAAVSTIGLMVVGALIPSVVKANVAFQYKMGDVTLKIQDLLDQIMPNLVPALLAVFVYYLLGKNKMTPVKVIGILLVFSILCYVLGILK